MVQKSKGGKKCRSVKSGKNKKLEMKHHRKFNYKKKKIKEKEECVICYEEVEKKNDNNKYESANASLLMFLLYFIKYLLL